MLAMAMGVYCMNTGVYLKDGRRKMCLRWQMLVVKQREVLSFLEFLD